MVYNGFEGTKTEACDADSVEHLVQMSPLRFDPEITYGKKKEAPAQFLPQFYHYANKTLTFNAFFKETVFESPLEHYRVRQVKIHYFLEDDTVTIIEPEVKNSGFKQGRLVRRSKIVKNDAGDFYSWKDFNVGIDIPIYGIVYHTVSCDAFTKEFLLSQGIVIGESENMPADPYIEKRKCIDKQQLPATTMSPDDKLRRFLEYDGKILRFNVVWDYRDEEFGELRPYTLCYYLADDTIEVREVRKRNDGRDPFPLLLRRQKLPKNWKDVGVNFPSISLEVTDADVTEYYSPKDLMVGNTVFVLGRRFLIHDCDPFTRKYFAEVLGMTQGDPICLKEKERTLPKREIPPHIGIGEPEDSLQSCFNLQPQRPKTDFVKYIANAGKVLRYTAKLDWVHPEDQDRNFIISYSLADGKVLIQELPNRSTGLTGGKFLKSMRLAKHNTNPDDPDYYSPADFGIGSEVVAYGHHFTITGVDLFVYRYMQENPEKFQPELVEGVRRYLKETGALKDENNPDGC
ncbi:EF-hand domain-containing protein 1-like isoform X2 [Ischnura elegans]|nr:EF-hand domain-containing protein 1-like isoform X2 [Ischnura elegans]XP_046392295.1 EF-hand domain-containing protein 1-like isoform X2 [Ischnura elegans]